MALLDNILHRMRFPKFLGILAAEFDNPLVRLWDNLTNVVNASNNFQKPLFMSIYRPVGRFQS